MQHKDNIVNGQLNASRVSHGERVDFSFVMALVAIIFTNMDISSRLNFTVIEPWDGDGTFSITIWVVFHYLFGRTPRVITIKIDPARHAATNQWLSHFVRNKIGINLPHTLPLILCDDFSCPQNPIIICAFSNYCKVVAFVNNASVCLCGDPLRPPKETLEKQLAWCLCGSIVITLDSFFSTEILEGRNLFHSHPILIYFLVFAAPLQ